MDEENVNTVAVLEENECCEDENCVEEEMTQEEVVNDVDDKVHALIELLIEKNILTEDEIAKKIGDFYESEEDESESDGEEVSCEDSGCSEE